MQNISRRMHLLLLISLLGSISAGIWVWHASADTKNPSLSTPTPTPVRTAPVSVSSFQPTEVFSGFVRSVNQTDISSKMPGYVVSLLREPGERVRSGDILAVLDGHELVAGNQSASLALTAALAALDRTEQYTRQQVDAAETSLSKVKDDRDRGSATSKDVRVAEDAVRTAKRFRDVTNAQAEASVVAARGSDITAKDSLENRLVRAPFSGIISAKRGSIGTLTSPGNALYTLLSPDNLEVSVSVPLRLATFIKKGTPVSILPEHSDRKVDGVVFSIAPAGNAATGETVATVRLREPGDSAEQSILPGEYASVEFPIESTREAVFIPDSAVLRQYDETFVFVVNDSQVYRRRITLGHRFGNSREIISGLNTDDVVVTEGLRSLREGMTVRTPNHE